RVSLLKSAAAEGDEPSSWVEVSHQHLTYERYDQWAEELAEIRTAADLDALVRRGRAWAGGAWEDPVPGSTTQARPKRESDGEAGG
ncbi:MAG TPA: hypothetical protein VH475_13505, partial [Tepidisphaeraceae bacterium]